jgi:mRNA interferase RelE/StbE
MQKYTVSLTKRAEKQLDKLPDLVAEPIFKSLSALAYNPRPHGYKKLKGREAYRIRVGAYRVIYSIFDKVLIVEVIDIGHRKEIYL